MNADDQIKLLFARYAEEVGGYLPASKRKDIQMEIISMLEDSLDDLSIKQNRTSDEDMALEVLRNQGAPIKFAAAYRPDDNLMQPRTYQLFKQVAGVVLAVLIFELLLSLGLSIGKADVAWAQLFGDWFTGLFASFGGLVLSFAILERTTPAEWLVWPVDFLSREWDPSRLKKHMDKKTVSRREYWFEAFWLVLLIILFGFFPQGVGIGNNMNGQWTFLPVLSDAYAAFQPWLVLYFIGRLVFCVAMAMQGYWDTRMRIGQIVVKVYGLILLNYLLTGPSIINPSPEVLSHLTVPSVLQRWLVTGDAANSLFHLVVGISLVVNSFQLVVLIIRLIQDRTASKGYAIG